MFAVQLLLAVLLFNYAQSLPTNGVEREALNVAGGNHSDCRLKRRAPMIEKLSKIFNKDRQFAIPDAHSKRNKPPVVTLGSGQGTSESEKSFSSILSHHRNSHHGKGSSKQQGNVDQGGSSSQDIENHSGKSTAQSGIRSLFSKK
ncbi:hypothetical protein PCASD_12470 [Puccinia coronata f. sp. avenae]|uniref:Uncharacterized protein n=2 Tax=Puccinia coronata f. sp. avenae TaxID=200324 RepID=A0A2N5U588_9BASI|nr:hypothetical protein PCASD_12470 [Puccinia coronata f. sp. avenae]